MKARKLPKPIEPLARRTSISSIRTAASFTGDSSMTAGLVTRVRSPAQIYAQLSTRCWPVAPCPEIKSQVSVVTLNGSAKLHVFPPSQKRPNDSRSGSTQDQQLAGAARIVPKTAVKVTKIPGRSVYFVYEHRNLQPSQHRQAGHRQPARSAPGVCPPHRIGRWCGSTSMWPAARTVTAASSKLCSPPLHAVSLTRCCSGAWTGSAAKASSKRSSTSKS